jgi:hypothetical protein
VCDKPRYSHNHFRFPEERQPTEGEKRDRQENIETQRGGEKGQKQRKGKEAEGKKGGGKDIWKKLSFNDTRKGTASGGDDIERRGRRERGERRRKKGEGIRNTKK